MSSKSANEKKRPAVTSQEPAEVPTGNNHMTIMNPHILAALSDDAVAARDLDSSADSFTSWTRT